MRDAARRAALLALSAARTCAARRGQLDGRAARSSKEPRVPVLPSSFSDLANIQVSEVNANGAGPTHGHASTHTQHTHTHWACKALVDGPICSLFCVCGCV